MVYSMSKVVCFYVHQAWLKMKNIFYNACSYIMLKVKGYIFSQRQVPVAQTTEKWTHKFKSLLIKPIIIRAQRGYINHGTACPRLCVSMFIRLGWRWKTFSIILVLMWNEDVQFIINMCEHLDSLFLLRKTAIGWYLLFHICQSSCCIPLNRNLGYCFIEFMWTKMHDLIEQLI
jgi:hypothetical protein